MPESIAILGLVEPRINGLGVVRPPEFTAEDFAAIKQRADLVEDQTIKTDLFRLILELESLNSEKHRG